MSMVETLLRHVLDRVKEEHQIPRMVQLVVDRSGLGKQDKDEMRTKLERLAREEFKKRK